MLEMLLVAGFGGQGVLRIGQMICYAGIDEGREVSWYPSYGSAMRGGTANCSVVVSDEQVPSPVISPGEATALIAMNQPSLDSFESMLAPGGCLLINSSLIKGNPKRDDLKIYHVPANDIAVEEGNPLGANMVALGAYAAVSGTVELETLFKIVDKTFVDKKAKYAAVNKKLLRRGYDCIQSI